MTTVPMTYDATSDLVVRTPALTPALSKAGDAIVDPAFGCRILRVTDGDTAVPLNFSYRTPSAPNQMAWTAEGDRFYVVNDQGGVFAFDFDRVNMKATFNRSIQFGIEPCFPRVRGKRDLMYGVRYISNHVIERYYFGNPGAFSTILDLKTVDPTLTSSVYTSSIYVSGGPVERAVVNFGGTGQDRHMKLIVFDINNPATRRMMNTLTSTIDGQPMRDMMGQPVIMNHPMHSISISEDGSTVRIDPVGTAAWHWLYDWNLNCFEKVTIRPWGHYALGWQREVNEDQGNDPKMQWQVRDLALSRSNAPTARITSRQTPSNLVAYHGDHTSWHNASSVANKYAPFFSECQQGGAQPAGWGFWSNEIIAVQSVGEERVWRFCHHRMNGYTDTDPNVGTFFYQPLLQVDPLGEFCLFSSNWDKTLGVHPSAPASSRHRVDVFMVRLRQERPEPPVGVPATTITLYAGEPFTQVAPSGGAEFLGKRQARVKIDAQRFISASINVAVTKGSSITGNALELHYWDGAAWQAAGATVDVSGAEGYREGSMMPLSPGARQAGRIFRAYIRNGDSVDSVMLSAISLQLREA